MLRKGIGVVILVGLMVLYYSPSNLSDLGKSMIISANAQNQATPGAQQPKEGLSITQEGNVSLDFLEADIRNVLKILSFKSGVNIVASPDVTGLVTIQLNDVPWQQALDVILQTYGYAYDKKGNIITVMTIEALKQRREDSALLAEQEPLITHTFTLNYAKVTDVIASVEKMKTERGSINYDVRTNTLIVRDISGNVELIGEIVKELDKPTPQVLIEAKIVETILNDQENLGIDWVAQVAASGTTIPHVWPFTTASDNKFLPDPIPAAQRDDFAYGTLNFSQLQAVLEMLKTRTDTNVLSNPRVVTLDNQKATIDVGTEYPYPKKFFNEDTGTWQLSDWEYRKIGIILDVTPHVNAKGLITLDIHPKVTEILSLIEDTESGSTAPELSNEEARTQVMIKNGETLVIAGLIKDKLIDTKAKVPILGDIPILGLVFRKSEKTVTKTDLLIFITPHIVTPEIPSDS